MKQYPKYKPSNIDWIGDIPEHWDVKRLKYVATASPSNIDKKSKEDEDSVFLCNYVDVYKNDFITDEIEFMKATASKAQIEKFTLRKGDIIATKDSESANDIGIAALVKQDFENVVCGYHLTYIKPEKLVGEYLFRQFQSEYIKRKFETLANGVTRYALGVDSFNCLNLVLPPESEQIEIANYLDKKTQEIDQLIEDKKKLLKLVEEEKKAIICQVVTKGINPNTEMKDSCIDWIGEIPKHWELKKLKYVFNSLNNIRIPLSSEERGKMLERTYDYYGASGIIDKVESYLFDEPLLLIGEDGANLLTRSSRLVFIAKGNYWVNNHAHILKPKFGILEYYSELLELFDFSLWVTGSAQPKLTSENLMNIQIIVPPVEEQELIMKFLEIEFVKVNSKMKKIKKLIKLLTEYRFALISEAVTGKVKVIN